MQLNQRLREAKEHRREIIDENLQTMGVYENSHQHETHRENFVLYVIKELATAYEWFL